MFALKPLLLLCIVATTLAENSCSQDSLQNQHSLEPNDLLFSLYLKAYGKEYCDDEEYKQRQKNFENALEIINNLSKQHPNTTFGLNHMSDWSDAEHHMLHGFDGGLLAKGTRRFKVQPYVPQGNAPESLDFREEGLVTEVKVQGQCGSCYVFSAIGNIEGQYAKKYKKLISLSEQQGLDCDTEDHGCHGGNPVHVYDTLVNQGGSEQENDYPYQARQGQCSTDSSKIVVKVTGGQILKVADEEALKDALYNYGPLSIAMFFEIPELTYYMGGIADPGCGPNMHPTHALVLVGYGTEKGTPYWIIKNSWSTNWGENGYLRLIRGKNVCNMLVLVTTSTVA